ncbi:MAG: hypothetical protein J0M36_00080 [Caulobacterales bacterium]|nr:hypothetical protein [Caulobacterales bacterium]
MFDDGGTVVELQTARSVRRAVENGVLKIDTLVTLIALDGSTRRLRAAEIEALRPLFGQAEVVDEKVSPVVDPPIIEAASDEISAETDPVVAPRATQITAVQAAFSSATTGTSAPPSIPPAYRTAASAKPGGCGLVAWGWTLLIGGLLLSGAYPPASLAFVIGLALLLFTVVRGMARRIGGGA